MSWDSTRKKLGWGTRPRPPVLLACRLAVRLVGAASTGALVELLATVRQVNVAAIRALVVRLCTLERCRVAGYADSFHALPLVSPARIEALFFRVLVVCIARRTLRAAFLDAPVVSVFAVLLASDRWIGIVDPPHPASLRTDKDADVPTTTIERRELCSRNVRIAGSPGIICHLFPRRTRIEAEEDPGICADSH